MKREQWVRDGTLSGPERHEIDIRNRSGSVWLTIKTDTDLGAERVCTRLLRLLNQETRP